MFLWNITNLYYCVTLFQTFCWLYSRKDGYIILTWLPWPPMLSFEPKRTQWPRKESYSFLSLSGTRMCCILWDEQTFYWHLSYKMVTAVWPLIYLCLSDKIIHLITCKTISDRRHFIKDFILFQPDQAKVLGDVVGISRTIFIPQAGQVYICIVLIILHVFWDDLGSVITKSVYRVFIVRKKYPVMILAVKWLFDQVSRIIPIK